VKGYLHLECKEIFKTSIGGRLGCANRTKGCARNLRISRCTRLKLLLS